MVEVLQQLWEAQHGLERDGWEAQRLHKHGGVQQQPGGGCTQHDEAQAEEDVVFKCTPLPEGVYVQVYRGSRINRERVELGGRVAGCGAKDAGENGWSIIQQQNRSWEAAAHVCV